MRMIIAAKYNQRCRECSGKIKAGTLVNWERGHGIWHYPNCSVSPDVNTKDSYSLEVNNREEEVMSSGNEAMGSDDNGGTINISDLIKALHGMTEKKVPVVESEPEIVSVEKKQKRPANMVDVRKSRRRRSTPEALTKKQISFCELMALGADRADAYFDSFNLKDRAFAGNAGRQLLGKEKIRDKIMELKRDLLSDTAEDPEAEAHKFLNDIKMEGAKGGWAFTLTERQEKFCEAMAAGHTRTAAYKKSGYYLIHYSEGKIRQLANNLMGMPKIKVRIAALTSGAPVADLPPAIKPFIAKMNDTQNPAKRSKAQTPPKPAPVKFVEALDIVTINSEFVDNFIELIKAHGRLVHHAVVTRGQKEVGIPGADVKGMEAAVCRSLEALRDTLGDKLSQLAAVPLVQKNYGSSTEQDVGNAST